MATTLVLMLPPYMQMSDANEPVDPASPLGWAGRNVFVPWRLHRPAGGEQATAEDMTVAIFTFPRDTTATVFFWGGGRASRIEAPFAATPDATAGRVLFERPETEAYVCPLPTARVSPMIGHFWAFLAFASTK